MQASSTPKQATSYFLPGPSIHPVASSSSPTVPSVSSIPSPLPTPLPSFPTSSSTMLTEQEIERREKKRAKKEKRDKMVGEKEKKEKSKEMKKEKKSKSDSSADQSMKPSSTEKSREKVSEKEKSKKSSTNETPTPPKRKKKPADKPHLPFQVWCNSQRPLLRTSGLKDIAEQNKILGQKWILVDEQTKEILQKQYDEQMEIYYQKHPEEVNK
jgi:hypothetical protein